MYGESVWGVQWQRRCLRYMSADVDSSYTLDQFACAENETISVSDPKSSQPVKTGRCRVRLGFRV